MPIVNIPESERPRLAKLARLSEKSADALAAALKNTPPLLNPRRLAERVDAGLQGTIQDVQDLVRTLLALEAFREGIASPVGDFAESVREGMLSATCDEALFGGDNGLAFTESLVRLLQLPSVRLAAKAQDLVAEQQCSFDNARVISDIRAVFQSNPELPPHGAVVFHVLRLEYWENGESKTIHIAMDSDDLEDLRDAIQRAFAKEKTLRELFAQARIPVFE